MFTLENTPFYIKNEEDLKIINEVLFLFKKRLCVNDPELEEKIKYIEYLIVEYWDTTEEFHTVGRLKDEVNYQLVNHYFNHYGAKRIPFVNKLYEDRT